MKLERILTSPKTLLAVGALAAAATIMTPIDESIKLGIAKNKQQNLQEQYDNSDVFWKLNVLQELEGAKGNVRKAEMDYNNFYNAKKQNIQSAVDTYTKLCEQAGSK